MEETEERETERDEMRERERKREREVLVQRKLERVCCTITTHEKHGAHCPTRARRSAATGIGVCESGLYVSVAFSSLAIGVVALYFRSRPTVRDRRGGPVADVLVERGGALCVCCGSRAGEGWRGRQR